MRPTIPVGTCRFLALKLVEFWTMMGTHSTVVHSSCPSWANIASSTHVVSLSRCEFSILFVYFKFKVKMDTIISSNPTKHLRRLVRALESTPNVEKLLISWNKISGIETFKVWCEHAIHLTLDLYWYNFMDVISSVPLFSPIVLWR
jgi:hypothetical protein